MTKNRRRKKKIGRNDPCPCGSNIKYKKCCINKKNANFKYKSYSGKSKLISSLSVYDQTDILRKIAGLQLLPDNHSTSLRLEQTLRIITSEKFIGTKQIKPSELNLFFKTYFPENGSIGLQEDPPETLFTENIDFFGGNYLVYPGISSKSSIYILQNLLEAVYQSHNLEIMEFGKILYPSIFGLLTLSNEIGRKLNHSRYMESSEDYRKNIKIPNIKTLDKLSQAVFFSKNSLNRLFGNFRFGFNPLLEFIIKIGDLKLKVYTSIDENPLLIRPLIEIDHQLIVGIPGSIIDTIRHFIWSKATLKSKIFLKTLINDYRKLIFSKILSYCYFLQFIPLKITLPKWNSEEIIKESVFAIDYNKIAFIQLLTDDGKDYEIKNPFTSYKIDHLTRLIEERQSSIKDFFKNENGSQFDNILFITIFCGIGRGFVYSKDKTFENGYEILLFADELDVLSHLKDVDQLTLWKYAEAYNDINKELKISRFSFLDSLALYFNLNYSYYVNNEKSPSLLIIEPGYGRNLRLKASILFDRHITRYNNHSFQRVIRRHLPSEIPIYLPETAPFTPIRIVEGYQQPIWIHPSKNGYNKLDFEFSDMFAYWIWQITKSVKDHLSPLGFKPIIIFFEINITDEWFYSEQSREIPKIDEIDINFNSKINETSIKINIPKEVMSYLLRIDNFGEKLIIRELLHLYGRLLEINNLKNTLEQSTCNSIIEKYIPLGQKKQINLVNPRINPILHMTGMFTPRVLKQHNVEKGLNNLDKALGKKLPSLRMIKDKNQAIELLHDIVVVYFKRVKLLLNQFEYKDLLINLIKFYELIVHKKEIDKLTIPTSIECFWNIQEKTEQIRLDRAKVNPTALALRSLIEVISAEPPSGLKMFNLDDFDELIANMHLLIDWAFIADGIQLDLIKPEIVIHNTGRISVNDDKGFDVLRPFIKAKTYEDVERAVKSFRSYFEDVKEENTFNRELEKLEKIYEAEFGLNFTKQAIFLGLLTNLGLNNENFNYSIPLSNLKNKVIKELKWNEEEFYKAIDLFSLVPRKKWEIAPKGFEKNDIWPWIYNRRLSYIKKPLVVIDGNNGEKNIFWGPRNVHDSSRQLIYLIRSGRYKFHQNSSKEMKQLIGNIKDKIGKKFELQTKSWLESNTKLMVEHGVEINPRSKFYSINDLGDIDNLAIDFEKNIIFSLECKKINYGRNPKEIANEFDRLKRSSNSWIGKHLKRDKWLKNNKDKVIAAYNIVSKDIEIKSYILTAEEIPTPFIDKMPIKFISFTRLKRDGIGIFYEN